MAEYSGSILADVARLMRRSFDARARGIGVTRPQWQVLSALRCHEGVTQGKLADLLDVEPITVCRMVDRLQEADLVERRSDPADRRSWRLYLTAKAHDLLGHLRPLADEMLEEAFEGVEDADRIRLMATLERVRQNLTRRPPGSVGEPMVSHG
jgi:DNA-binding MarR family transcriptional regulator